MIATLDAEAGAFEFGAVYRCARKYSATPAVIDGLPNFFTQLYSPGKPLPMLDAGINSLAPVKTSQGTRRPAILFSSSPHKAGTEKTPWEDVYNPEQGSVLYFGDNKTSKSAPEAARGNVWLLEELPLHRSKDPQARLRATPLLLFRRTPWDGRKKGNVQFAGLAVIERAEPIRQFNRSTGEHFGNYSFDLALLSLAEEKGCLDCTWILARREPSVATEDTMKDAPKAWREWVRLGHEALPVLRSHTPLKGLPS
jgi:hypothetical protein